MRPTTPQPDEIARAPEPFRAALAELVEIGMTVARMLARVAAGETTLAEAAATMAPDVSPVATSLAEAIEADRAASAASEARRDIVRRSEIVAAAFAQVSRAIRRTVLLAERLDCGWARPGRADCRDTMMRRQIARAVGDAIVRDADGAEADRLRGELAERLDSLDRLDDLGWAAVEDIVRDICRDLGVAVKAVGLDLGLPFVRSRGGTARARASPA
ncbi:hypothetical protein [Acidisphaera sp. L21]|uniref:hypothetical protein n=1 Tax=Acidisphaera sp. L21 TaxID=1641851 RepID=UPI00131D6014|nr:hypothetical protein [Acidisphaera sp. L21]